MADDDINEKVRDLVRPQITRMRERGVSKDDAVRISGQPFEIVDSIYNAGKAEQAKNERDLRQRKERGE